jgi:superfamily II DNA or RNA helicase
MEQDPVNPYAEIDPVDEKRIVVRITYMMKDLIKQLPGSTWSHKDQAWKLPLGWSSCITLRAVFGPDLEIGPRLTAWAQEMYRTRIGPALALRDEIEREGDPALYPFQRAGVAFLSIAERALLADEMGCLTGDTEIILNRAGRARRITLSKLYEKWTQSNGRYVWDKTIPSRVKSMFPNGQLRLNTIENVLDKGVRPVVTLTLESGKTVTCTYDHKIARPGFEWTPAEKLQVGDEVLINGTPVKADQVVKIEDAGEQRVYDLVMANPARNFVANGIVVHNSGKTVQTLKALQLMHLEGKDVFPVLVVCPNSMKRTWQREAEKWWPGLTFLPVRGSAVQRRKILETPAHGYIMNWESLRGHSRLAPYGSISLRRCKECGGEDERITATQCHVHPRELQQLQFQTVIADECHRAKDPRSQQTRALWAAAGKAPYRFALTGTPIANAPDDLWPIMHWLDPQQFPSRTRWIDRFCEVMYNAFGAPTVIGIKPEREEEFFTIINPMMRRMPKSLVLPFLPPIIHERREVEMSPRQAKAYKQMSEQMLAELENGDILLAASPLVKATRLIQFSSAFAHLNIEQKEDGTTEGHVKLSEPSCKIDAFMDDLPDYEGKSVVVFAQSRQLIELLSDKLSKQKKPIAHGLITGAQNDDERQKHIDDFQSGKTQLILCTVQAGGTGITLTQGSIAVFLQRSWSLIDTTQAEARIHRIGSEIHENVTVIDYVTTGTIEDYQIAAIDAKSDRLEAIVRDADLLKRVLMRQSIEEDSKVDTE